MPLVPYDPFKHLNSVRREFDRVFADFPATFGGEHGFGEIRVDVHETESEIVASCDIPGLESKEDVHIDVENNMLHISGSVNRSNEVKEENIHRKERFVGRFHRSVTLPGPVSTEGIKASYKNGVLEVRMPKDMKEQKKRIDVEFH
ncbi:Hsp20/alpha crystallin family protein [Bacillus sp. FSL M8-0052]|uniref:Hsp20/alpha crystallin family protein n=1 Tax=Bacillus glycinifermentans TaxID=1664069 RepID=A0AAJ4D2U9_9BACI|nr:MULTISPECIES: Hsp20/alpha crystallin family protein [Bacillus]MBU8788392.1 Hsp20/alpha crystallin family protein [Bacillus glycinifermentans]MDU0070944.1 Hsp20/alpha crystallin family protein [Bacillus sp. IG6]MED8018811.1 Hsp20/alpha crystallin family protein [Bacillus glycinifermentans]NUJ18630.1 Hsp20/alpha crystallin family protein [Bacillus glycinifermentans]QAT65878.1 Hsp20/alpha crystallin family protein [Bacillus glycinifermentans]